MDIKSTAPDLCCRIGLDDHRVTKCRAPSSEMKAKDFTLMKSNGNREKRAKIKKFLGRTAIPIIDKLHNT